jgi:uncharacterized protein YggE
VKPAVFAFLMLASAAPAAAQSASEAPVIVAQGEGTVRRAADVAWVHVAVEARGSTPEAARQQAASAMTSVVNALRRTVSSDALETASFSVQPEMEYPDNRPRVRGYVARNQVEVRVDDLERLPRVLDAGVSGGATSIAGLRFDLKRRDEAEREALRLAVEDAMRRAEAIAGGAGRSLGAIVRIAEQRSSGPPMRPMLGMAAAQRSGDDPTPISPGAIEVQAQVTATVGIR